MFSSLLSQSLPRPAMPSFFRSRSSKSLIQKECPRSSSGLRSRSKSIQNAEQFARSSGCNNGQVKKRPVLTSDRDSFASDADTECSMEDSPRPSMDDLWAEEKPVTSTRKLKKSISFNEQVRVIRIPNNDALDKATKRQMWYTRQEFRQMRRDKMMELRL